MFTLLHVILCCAHGSSSIIHSSTANRQQIDPAAPVFAVYVRMFEEEAFIDYFCEFYLALGFQSIVILDIVDSRRAKLSVNIAHPERVHLHRVRNEGNLMLAKYFHLVVETGADVSAARRVYDAVAR